MQLERLDSALLSMERDGGVSGDERAELLRALHTLKGNSGMLGFVALRDYLHGVESVLREPRDSWPQPLLDRLFEGAAALRRAVEHAGTDREAESLARLAALPDPDLPPTTAPAESPSSGNAADVPSLSTADETAAPDTAAAGESEEPGAGDDLPGLAVSTETLRVPFAKLDALANQVAELLGAHAALDDFLIRHRRALEAAGLRRPLQDRLEVLDRVAGGLRTSATDLRLVPVRRVFDRFPSLIRDLAREQGKRIRVVLEGEDTELDKSTVDILAEPLLHLVRNAVDHGIRLPEEREASGKEAEGTITLRAVQSGDSVRIEVGDDGTGLDRRRILERAREAGLVAPGDVPDADEVADLIFRAGFSTRRDVDTVSGRGIGMDIVAKSVARLRGNLEVEDTEGLGTRFVMHLPLTIAILPVLLFETAGQTLALPALEVEDTRRLGAVARIAGAEVITDEDDDPMPLARPARLFGWDSPAPGATAERYAMVVRRGSRSVAIAADRLLDQRDVLVKALPAYLGQPKGVSGAAIAPDGRVILLLDAGAIIDLNLDFHRRTARVARAAEDPDR